mmetsp:Transcript_18142/g.17518  ORF Transcript_18142/g.17518 Transcript_18142/m.17518 type:complete len:208 (-) Transcript_18142:191-814(-)|eukprot:CAMPEP_0197833046 /NCGR_PEP_ID=MMETSP1437-20131217/17387_1 /TAXON_ID=49252 ORGANISM="Eucampia antarctica, Strain CCMP1452" /NCGR_SAMPLE_ID=MMETSP1437 /ASSEMBLY_ACC=CAM_ASM_001096 /LENGTH=207 /DNA_ID=CAMNT_0043436795 /DNA_START=156 /DNA_END=779 /DNA_ORIENTATION=-
MLVRLENVVTLLLSLVSVLSLLSNVESLNVVIPGGTGKIGRLISAHLADKGHDVTILSRNVFLASTPSRVSHDYGWLGRSYVEKYSSEIKLRDWDGGDLLDIVGCDWMGWQDDALKGADVIINLVGGYTEQRVMACDRIVRESLRLSPQAKQITMSPIDEDITPLKLSRVTQCEAMLLANCVEPICLRAEINDIQGACDQILQAIDK